MKKLILSLVAIATISLSSFGQAPEGFKYQAVVRDAGNLILNNQSVGMQLTIQQGSIGGTAVYTETFIPTSNAYGLVNIEIGSGNTTDDFSTIDWSAGPYFIETAIDVTGGTSYTVMGTSQLMSVPYALYAKTSGNGAGPQGPAGPAGADGQDGVDGLDGATGPAGPQGPQGLPGNDGADGLDGATGLTGPQGIQGPAGADGIDGAIGATGPAGVDGNDGATGPAGADGNDGATGPAGADGDAGATGPAGADGQGGVTTAGTNVTITGTGTVGDPYVVNATGGGSPTYTIGLWPELGGYVFWVSADGKHGLVAETQDQGTAIWYEAQNLISNPSNHSVNGQKFRDWRLPTKYELNEMYLQQLAVGGFAFNFFYWSSTEYDSLNACIQIFFNGVQFDNNKGYPGAVRSVRAF